jgi:enoyl-[acyl-carrier protein] reductase II
METNNSICRLLNIQYPIIQGGMVWCSGWRLAAAVSNSGGLGLIGAGSMTPELLAEHITKAQQATNKPFGVNIPLMYSRIEESIDIIIKSGVKIVFTSAGNPALYTKRFKNEGIIVVHVVANQKFAEKCEQAGVNAIVAEGFEAGGHNGREETSAFTLIPLIRACTSLPLIAAGGISSGQSILAAMALGADGVQIGTLFAASQESSAHDNFKHAIIEAGDGATFLSYKKVSPTRMLKNLFWEKLNDAEQKGASKEDLMAIVGKGHAKMGIFEGNITEGELEMGQVAALIKQIRPASDIIQTLISEFNQATQKLTIDKNVFSL